MFSRLFKKMLKVESEVEAIENQHKSTANIAKRFNISSDDMNKVLVDLKWIELKGNWQIATELGISKGAEQKYNAKTKQRYILLDEKVKNNFELISAIKIFRENKDIKKEINDMSKKETGPEETTVKKRLTNAEKKEKGNKYEEYIANFFRENGYYVWEHGKEKGMKDSSIDLIIKREEHIYFVQCKDWEKWKIDHKEVKATRMDVGEYLKNNEVFYNLIKNYKQKILYITSKECLTAGAYKYIEENRETLEYQVIPVKA